MSTKAKNDGRSDAEIFAAARNALDNRPAVPGTVRVYVENGVATLTGTVQLASERADAEAAVRGVEGVERLVNQIVISRPISAEGFEPPDDAG